MNPKTLLIGFFPESKKETSVFLRNKKYAEDLLRTHDLGDVIVCNESDYAELLSIHNPYIVIVTCSSIAEEIKTRKPDALVYLTVSINSIFSRKNEVDEKIAKQKKVFMEIEGFVKQIRESTDEERQSIRNFASISYDNLYKMIQKAIIGDNEELRKKAWDLLFGEGERHSNLIWMRVQLMAEMWEHADWDVRERLMCISMEKHIEQRTVRKLGNFTDMDGQEYHQYMFIDPLGNDMNHIRRLPFASKGQDRYSYENLLEKNEIPTNYMRVQVEANSLREQWDKYLLSECTKVKKVLEEWEKDPNKSKKDLGVIPWNDYDDANEPLSEREIESLKNFLQAHDH